MNNRRECESRRDETNRRSTDRRLDDRTASKSRIRFLRSGTSADDVLHGELLDVSPSGIRIVFEEPLRAEEKLLLEVRDDEGRCFNLTAQVVWSEERNDRLHDVGCELCVELTDRQHTLLQAIAGRNGSNEPG